MKNVSVLTASADVNNDALIPFAVIENVCYEVLYPIVKQYVILNFVFDDDYETECEVNEWADEIVNRLIEEKEYQDKGVDLVMELHYTSYYK